MHKIYTKKQQEEMKLRELDELKSVNSDDLDLQERDGRMGDLIEVADFIDKETGLTNAQLIKKELMEANPWLRGKEKFANERTKGENFALLDFFNSYYAYYQRKQARKSG